MREIGSVQQTRKYFPKTLRGLKSLYKRCQKLPKSSVFCPFSCSCTRQKVHLKDQCYAGCPYDWEFNTDEAMQKNAASSKDQHRMGEGDEDVCSGGFMKFSRPCFEESKKEGKVEEPGNLSFWSEKGEDKIGEDLVEEKMRELEMIGLGDLENVLDMEEALHYYSHLRSPVYLGIVNKFIMGTYSDFLVPRASASSNSFKKRFLSTRI